MGEKARKTVSIVIPVRNEAESLSILFGRLDGSLATRGIAYEAIVIDDHSTDRTPEIIRRLARKYPIRYFLKKGLSGKAYSILEGARAAKGDSIVMLDADLEYPPEAIPAMIEKSKLFPLVVARRKVYASSLFRRLGSRVNAFIFGRVLHGLKLDVQSGLKLFPKQVIAHISERDLTPWAFDIPLLVTARNLGFASGEVDITFERRAHGVSKIHYASATIGVISTAVRLLFTQKRVFPVRPNSPTSMLGAGVVYKQKKFITHTTLSERQSALATVSVWQKGLIGVLLMLIMVGLLTDTTRTMIVIVAFLSAFYFIDVLFNLILILKSLYQPPEITVSQDAINGLEHATLPLYSILCPLYHEAHVLPQFIEAIERLDWPKDKLDVLLLLEEDDQETIEKANTMALPSYMRVVVVPDSEPKTKPKACNYGLAKVRGEYVVIYDAEDVPDPLQLKKAYLAFRRVPENVACLQAKLNYYNPHHNLLTRLFTAEYSLWFDVMLTGLQTIETSIPLGGTSNHFRTKTLLELLGWDPFNVTEDCDLGVRLFSHGYKTAIIDSTTMEEANSNIFNWLRQRSRWIKGYIQTYLVHMRNPVTLVRKQGVHAFVFQLVVGGKIAFMLINPFLWLATILYFTMYKVVGATIESYYPTLVFYMAAFSAVFGNFLFIYYYMIGVAKREHWALMKYVFLIPFYWLMVSAAAGMAFLQLLFKPHYWEKTVHGLHLSPKPRRRFLTVRLPSIRPHDLLIQKIRSIRAVAGTGALATGSVLVFAAIVGNFFNFLYSAFLGRSISVQEFGLISLFNSFFYIAQIPLNALSGMVTYRSAFMLGKYETFVKEYWLYLRRKTLPIAVFVTVAWLLSIPTLSRIFHVGSFLPFALFTPLWVAGVGITVNSGFLKGSLKFGHLAFLIVLESILKFVFTVILVVTGAHLYVYLSIPLSLLVTYAVGTYLIRRLTQKPIETDPQVITYFPKRFFATSILSTLSIMAFLSFDMVLVKLFLTPVAAGQYALLSLVGKMIYFVGALFGQFISPLVSREEGAGRDSRHLFNRLILLTSFICLTGFIGIGMFGHVTLPFLFGEKVIPILPYAAAYALGIACFTVAANIVTFHQIKKEYVFAFMSFLFTGVQVIGLMFFHGNLHQVIGVMLFTGYWYLAVVSVLHGYYQRLRVALFNVIDLAGLFFPKLPEQVAPSRTTLRILILNWRDTKHVWAGGAEVYLHELAKRWATGGHNVTVFCGNDGKHPRNQVVDGVQVVRRGGFYTVYLWAFLYYVLRFRGFFDVVIDSANGVPFFSPLYISVPKILVVHHVHQEVFRKHLPLPLSWVARLVESKLMPLIYRRETIVTVSASSKSEIVRCGIAKAESIHIIQPGIDASVFFRLPKARSPLLLYLGRLKPYKNVDVAVHAFGAVREQFPKARLVIAGEGESMPVLRKLITSLSLESQVALVGKVTDEEKSMYLSKAWILLQPSSIEGWGITVIEANASGTPVIASNVHGLRDSVIHGSTGILVQPGEVNGFANAIEVLLTNKAYRTELSRSAYEWAKTFDWTKSAGQFEEILMTEVAFHRNMMLNKKLLPLWKVYGQRA